jgi:hypothetical protein
MHFPAIRGGQPLFFFVSFQSTVFISTLTFDDTPVHQGAYGIVHGREQEKRIWVSGHVSYCVCTILKAFGIISTPATVLP